MHPLKKLYSYSSKYKKDIRLAVIYSLLNKTFDILPELLIGVAVDIVVRKQDSFVAKIGIHDTLWQIVILGAITALIWMGESFYQYLYSLKWRGLSQNLQHDLRQDAYSHIQQLELSYFEDKSTGNLMSILNDDINQLENFINDGANQIIQVFFSSIAIGIIFFVIDYKIAMLSLLPIPFIIYGAFYFQKKLGVRYRGVRDRAGILNGKLNNNILGIATIKSYTAEKYELEQLNKISQDYRASNQQAIALSSAIVPIIRMAVMSGFLVNLVYGGYVTLHGFLAVGSYSVLIFLSQRLLWPLTYLATITDNYQKTMASINRVMDLLNTPIKINDGGTEVSHVLGKIVFDDVVFAYNTHNVLNHVSFSIDEGQSVAFVGSTGSGKSTLVKLLLHFYAPTSGKVLLDGVNINELNLNSLRKNIGFVSQEAFLIDDSIMNNIRYGSFEATDEEVIAAAKLAEVDEFVINLPDGYNTMVGERGQKLSGGQRQRLSLARAFLKNPRVLILDEATSAVDNDTEAAIKRSLDKVIVGRTTIMIAHRLSTIRNVDKIFVLDKGQIIESGKHEELVKHDGVYASLWALQTGEI